MRFSHAYLLLLSALLGPLPAVAGAANSNCVVKPGESAVAKRSANVLALAEPTSQAPHRLSFDCQDGAVVSVQLRSFPGQVVEAQFLLVRRASAVAEIEWDENTLSGWSELAIEQSGEGSVVTLRIHVPELATPGSVQSARLQFRSEQAGQADYFSLHIPLLIEIVEAGPLFRDNFDHTPDPVIGQFSMVEQ